MGIGNIGWSEFIVILAIALIFFGPRRLPGIAQAIGKSLREFQKALNEVKTEIAQASRETDVRTGSPRTPGDPFNLLPGVGDIGGGASDRAPEAESEPRRGPDPEPSQSASGLSAEVEVTTTPRTPEAGAQAPPSEPESAEQGTQGDEDEDDRDPDER